MRATLSQDGLQSAYIGETRRTAERHKKRPSDEKPDGLRFWLEPATRLELVTQRARGASVVFLPYSRRRTPRTRRSKSSAWRPASASTLSWETDGAPDSLAASVSPSACIPSARAMMTSQTVDMPT